MELRLPSFLLKELFEKAPGSFFGYFALICFSYRQTQETLHTNNPSQNS